MDVEHRLTFHADAAVQKRLGLIGVPASLGLNTVVLRESDRRWGAMSRVFSDLEGLDIQSARFKRQELDRAQALGLAPDWHHGYPQPEDDFGYLSATYDLSDCCAVCGGGAEQIAPFRMKAEPRWGRRSILQLNWVFGEYFVTPQVWERVFKPFGVGRREVLLARSLKPLSTVLQLIVPTTCDLAADGLAFEDCAACRRRRHPPVSADYLPAATFDIHLAKSRQVFGSGVRNWRWTICSQQVRRALLLEGVKGVSFHPCRS